MPKVSDHHGPAIHTANYHLFAEPIQDRKSQKKRSEQLNEQGHWRRWRGSEFGENLARQKRGRNPSNTEGQRR
jgi:hypothetical protein